MKSRTTNMTKIVYLLKNSFVFIDGLRGFITSPLSS